MKLLALELSTEACSVALWIDGDLRERHELAPRKHAELTLPWAEALLADAGVAKSQLDAIAVGRGPGAFTGVRLGVALAQGIAMALDLPTVPISTLAALAAGARRLPQWPAHGGEYDVFAAIDARMTEVYAAAYRLRADAKDIFDLHEIAAERIAHPDALALQDAQGGRFGVGTGFDAQDANLTRRWAADFVMIDSHALPRAADVAVLAVAAFARGETVAPERLEPAYLRNNVALTIAEQQALRGERGR